MIEYAKPYKFVLDNLWFYYQNEIYKGHGFIQWNPDDGFQIDATLNKVFAPVNPLKTIGQSIINDKNDAFNIWLKIRGLGSAIAPNVFPLAQKKSIIPDNHLSIKIKRVIFLFQWPKEVKRETQMWSGSAVLFTKTKIDFPDSLRFETTLGSQIIESELNSGLTHEDESGYSLTGRHLPDKSFELSWALPKSLWSKNAAWKFGEASRRALSVVFAQTIWIANLKVTRANREIIDFRKRHEVESLSYNFQPLLDFGPEQSNFNKRIFLKLVVFFAKGGQNADVCWSIFNQMADASRQKSWQGKELLLSTILEAVFRTINNRPFIAGKDFYGEKDRKRDMDKFQSTFLSNKWSTACDKALETHRRLRHRNAHPDWLTTANGAMSKEELKKSTKDLVFLSRFYGYMMLGLAGIKDLEPLFPIMRFSDETQQLETPKT